MVQASSNSPGLFEVINMAIERFMADVHTSMPGVVVSYDEATQTATVQPSLMKVLVEDGEPQALPPLLHVPVVFPATANAWVRLPIAEGDRVLLLFAERSLDTWFNNGGLVDPEIPARYALADAIAIPGLNARPNAIASKGAATSLEVVNGLGWLEITPAGKFKITNGAVDLLQVLDSILGHLMTLTTTNAIVGSPCAVSPATLVDLTADKVQLALLKA